MQCSPIPTGANSIVTGCLRADTTAGIVHLRADFFNFSNTRNFGIPEARISNAGFANQ